VNRASRLLSYKGPFFFRSNSSWRLSFPFPPMSFPPSSRGRFLCPMTPFCCPPPTIKSPEKGFPSFFKSHAALQVEAAHTPAGELLFQASVKSISRLNETPSFFSGWGVTEELDRLKLKWCLLLIYRLYLVGLFAGDSPFLSFFPGSRPC